MSALYITTHFGGTTPGIADPSISYLVPSADGRHQTIWFGMPNGEWAPGTPGVHAIGGSWPPGATIAAAAAAQVQEGGAMQVMPRKTWFVVEQYFGSQRFFMAYDGEWDMAIEEYFTTDDIVVTDSWPLTTPGALFRADWRKLDHGAGG